MQEFRLQNKELHNKRYKRNPLEFPLAYEIVTPNANMDIGANSGCKQLREESKMCDM